MTFLRRIWGRADEPAPAACTALDVGTEFAKALVFEIDPSGVGVVRGVKSLSASLFHEQLFRPDLVQMLLNGDRDGRYRAAVRQLDLAKTWDANAPR